ncbi:flagellar basal body protein [Shimia sp.]|uniref:flagellar basal body protein n=1 Tax=Shimia sp. TaxID=1954381 RepID=UPI003565BE4D
MNLSDVSLFGLASKRLQWLADRQTVISENIANADTADYRARDVESFESYLSTTADGAGFGSAEVVEAKAMWGEELSGNNIVLEEQLMEAGTTSSQYKLASSLYRKAHDLLLAAAGN